MFKLAMPRFMVTDLLVMFRSFGLLFLLLIFLTGRINAASTNTQTQRTDPCSEAVVLEKGITAPELIKSVRPKFENAASAERIGTPIIAEAVVTKEGTLSCIKIVRSNDPDLNQIFLEALSQWKYKPAQRKGKPIAIRLTITTTVDVH